MSCNSEPLTLISEVKYIELIELLTSNWWLNKQCEPHMELILVNTRRVNQACFHH